MLNEQIVAYILGDPNLREAREDAMKEAAGLLISAFGKETTEAWFFGMNQHLDDKSPAWQLRHAESKSEIEKVISAARSFVYE